MNSSFIVDVSAIALSETNGVEASWVHALPLGDYKHPIYGTISVTADRVKVFADNVKSKARGIDPSINYNHNNEDVAAGWVKDAEQRTDGLWLFIEWVKDAAEAIKAKKWRYFSSEFADEWEDPQGKKHKDVILGGALTNRPFMKNLVPVNLSEETYNVAFDLVSALTGKDVDTLKGGNMPLSEEDLKKIVEGVSTKLAESKINEPTPVGKSLADLPELKELAEANPLVATLIKFVETQKLDIETSAVKLKEADIAAKLNEFDRTKIVLTPVAKKLAGDIMMRLSDDLIEPFWKLLNEMKRGTSFLVELGERGGATVNYGSARTAIAEFDEQAKKLAESSKITMADAVERIAAENPALYTRYREELMNGVTQ
jgi:hypothetical protein